MPRSRESASADGSRKSATTGHRSGSDPRREPRVDLAVSSSTTSAKEPDSVRWPWPVTTIVGVLLVLVGQWAVLAGLITPAWMRTGRSRFTEVLVGAGKLWLTAQGVPHDLVGIHVAVIPLGLTLVMIVSETAVVRRAARSMSASLRARHQRVVRRNVGELAALAATVHVAVAAGVGAWAGPGSWLRLIIAALLVGTFCGLLGACWGARRNPLDRVAPRVRDVILGIGVTVITCLALATLLLGVALMVHAPTFLDMESALGARGADGVGVILIHVAWLPVIVVWALAWTLGVGVFLGSGTVTSALVTHVTVVPAIPILAATPQSNQAMTWWTLWMLAPILSAVVGAVFVLRGRDEAYGTTTRHGLATGVGAGLVLCVLAVLSTGSLGTGNLVRLGPNLMQFLAHCVGLLGASGAITGFAIGSWRWHHDPSNHRISDAQAAWIEPAELDEADQDTMEPTNHDLNRQEETDGPERGEEGQGPEDPNRSDHEPEALESSEALESTEHAHTVGSWRGWFRHLPSWLRRQEKHSGTRDGSDDQVAEEDQETVQMGRFSANRNHAASEDETRRVHRAGDDSECAGENASAHATGTSSHSISIPRPGATDAPVSPEGTEVSEDTAGGEEDEPTIQVDRLPRR